MSAGDTMQGRRLDWSGELPPAVSPQFSPGDYARDPEGVWWIRPPEGSLGSLRDHTVTEHEDGTITVSPSIVSPSGWHGYLERGVWREV